MQNWKKLSLQYRRGTVSLLLETLTAVWNDHGRTTISWMHNLSVAGLYTTEIAQEVHCCETYCTNMTLQMFQLCFNRGNKTVQNRQTMGHGLIPITASNQLRLTICSCLDGGNPASPRVVSNGGRQSDVGVKNEIMGY